MVRFSDFRIHIFVIYIFYHFIKQNYHIYNAFIFIMDFFEKGLLLVIYWNVLIRDLQNRSWNKSFSAEPIISLPYLFFKELIKYLFYMVFFSIFVALHFVSFKNYSKELVPSHWIVNHRVKETIFFFMIIFPFSLLIVEFL